MKRFLIIAAAFALTLAAPVGASAQQRLRDGLIGAGAGAIVGGPVGAVVGGGVGVVAGPEIERGARVGYRRSYNGGRRHYSQRYLHHRYHASNGRRQYR